MKIKSQVKKNKSVDKYKNLSVLATNVAVTPKVRKFDKTAIILSVALHAISK